MLPPKKHGRPFLLGEELNKKLQLYVKKVREGGGVTARILIAAAKRMVVACERSRLVEFGGHMQLGQHWAYSFFHRIKFVKRNTTTAKSKYKDADIARVKKDFLKDVVTTVEMEEIPAELILNWDQTAVKIGPTCTWTMERQGSNRIEVAGANKKHAITAVFCGTIGDFLLLHASHLYSLVPSTLPIFNSLGHHTLS